MAKRDVEKIVVHGEKSSSAQAISESRQYLERLHVSHKKTLLGLCGIGDKMFASVMRHPGAPKIGGGLIPLGGFLLHLLAYLQQPKQAGSDETTRAKIDARLREAEMRHQRQLAEQEARREMQEKQHAAAMERLAKEAQTKAETLDALQKMYRKEGEEERAHLDNQRLKARVDIETARALLLMNKAEREQGRYVDAQAASLVRQQLIRAFLSILRSAPDEITRLLKLRGGEKTAAATQIRQWIDSQRKRLVDDLIREHGVQA